MSQTYTIQNCCNGDSYTIQNLPDLIYVGETYYITGIAGLDDNCYTVISETPFNPVIYDGSDAVIYYNVTGCGDENCPDCPEEEIMSIMPFSGEEMLTSSECIVSVEGIDPTPTLTPTFTMTPTPTPTPPFEVIGFVGFKISNGPFNCNKIKRLLDCNGGYYYVSEPITFNGELVSTGTTFTAVINGGIPNCVTYIDDTDGTATDYISQIIEINVDCETCNVTPTPTLTPTMTSTPTPTPTITPTITSPNNVYYVYSACTSPNRMIIQTSYLSGVNIGEAFQYDGYCWTFVAEVQNYVPPGGFIVTNYVGNYFVNPIFVFSSCEECLTPEPTPSQVYREWNGSWAWNISCSPCYLTSGGQSITLYSSPSVNVLTDGVTLYTDQQLTNTLPNGAYFRYSQIIYEVGVSGEINFTCNAGSNC